MASIQQSYLELCRSSTHVSAVEVSTVPGLAQIEPYARRVLAEMAETHQWSTGDLDEAVAWRLRRQEILYDTTKRFDILMTEPVLRWSYCPPDTMVAQMDRLLSLQALRNVRVGIVPMTTPTPVIVEHSFSAIDGLVIVETSATEYQHQGDAEAVAYLNRMARYWEVAVEDEEARALILSAQAQHRAATDD